MFAWRNFRVLAFLVSVTSAPSFAVADYLLMNPPPDTDKPFLQGINVGIDNSCWTRTASNMLAGAGYGNGTTVQDRADDIYADMLSQFPRANPGWPDVALSWWLNSPHNVWPNNPYDVVTVRGNKSVQPWLNPGAPTIIGNQLRDNNMVGVALYNRNPATNNLAIHHAITAWGDDGDEAHLASNPNQLFVTDSDRDNGGDVQRYTYDAYSSTDGWTFDFATPHTTLEQIVTLEPTDVVTDHVNTQKVVGSYMIHQDASSFSATDLHYNVGTDVDILTYRTRINWPRPNNPSPPTITEDQTPPQNLTVDWDLSGNAVPFSNWVTITTEFVVPTWNSIEYSNVRWTYPDVGGRILAGFDWNLQTPESDIPEVREAILPNVTGGYVVGSFDIFAQGPEGLELVGEYRLQHEYDYFQNPELHEFSMTASEDGNYYIGNLRFGHSYGLLDDEEMWDFQNWMTEASEIQVFDRTNAIALNIDWSGLLPYPEQGFIPLVPEPSALSLCAIGLPLLPHRRRHARLCICG